jgi:hypothetical protein
LERKTENKMLDKKKKETSVALQIPATHLLLPDKKKA